MTALIPGSPGWHQQVTEDIVDPDRKIIDPHHHIFDSAASGVYLLPDLWDDTGSGHPKQQGPQTTFNAKPNRVPQTVG